MTQIHNSPLLGGTEVRLHCAYSIMLLRAFHFICMISSVVVFTAEGTPCHFYPHLYGSPVPCLILFYWFFFLSFPHVTVMEKIYLFSCV